MFIDYKVLDRQIWCLEEVMSFWISKKKKKLHFFIYVILVVI